MGDRSGPILGRIVASPPEPTCRCREIVLEHKQAISAARSWTAEAAANKALWDAFEVDE